MNFIKQWAGVLALIGVIALGLFAYSSREQVVDFADSLGASGGLLAENYMPYVMYNNGYNSNKSIKTTADMTVGASGTSYAGIVSGNCTIWAPANTIAATSSQQAVCNATAGNTIGALAGVTTDSICQVNVASSTVTTGMGLEVGGTSASSTAGSIVFNLMNFTGTTFTWSAAASSSSQWTYTCFDPA